MLSSSALAGGFQLWEENASGLGDYHAGAAAEADTVATIFYNPAGITRIKHQEVSAGVAFIPLNVAYTGTAGSHYVTNASGDTFNAVPNFHYVYPVSNRWGFAFEITTPFGLSTQYLDEVPVNSLATKTDLRTINLNPSIAVAINQYLSIGAGFDVLYGRAVYDADIWRPMTSDLTGWSTGYNAGALLQINPKTRLGVSYRSAITVNAKGDSEATQPGAGFIKSKASAEFPMPATTMLSLYRQLNSHWTVMTSAFYTQWSVFDKLVIHDLSTVTGKRTISILENYRDTWNFALGTKYRINPYVSLEAGFGHDETPTRIGYRDIRLPDNNHYVASTGVNIDIKPNIEWSIGWVHFFIPRTTIDNTKGGETVDSVGTVAADINVYGMQLTWSFG